MPIGCKTSAAGDAEVETGQSIGLGTDFARVKPIVPEEGQTFDGIGLERLFERELIEGNAASRLDQRLARGLARHHHVGKRGVVFRLLPPLDPDAAAYRAFVVSVRLLFRKRNFGTGQNPFLHFEPERRFFCDGISASPKIQDAGLRQNRRFERSGKTREPALDRFVEQPSHRFFMPGCVNESKRDALIIPELQPDGKRLHSADPEVQIAAELTDRFAELLQMGVSMGSKPFSGGCVPGLIMDGVHFMVAHDRKCSSRFPHCADGLKDPPDPGTSVDEVPEKDGAPSVGMPPHAVGQSIAEQVQQAIERIGLAVNVTDNVESGHLNQAPLVL